MSYLNQNERYYNYTFSNGARHLMTPIEAHKYAHRLKLRFTGGPGYQQEKKEKEFDGFGWHSGLQMSFRGPAHYRSYLKEHGLVEASFNDKPMDRPFNKPIWNEELIQKCVRDYGIEIGSVMTEALLNGELDWPDGSSENDSGSEF